MIRAENLTKRYGDRTVVRDLSFTVRPGTVTGIAPARWASAALAVPALLLKRRDV